jgi:FkbM family methyltransferase
MEISSISGLIVTIKTTKNFWQAVALKRSKQKKRIIFRNGLILQLSWSEYYGIRDLIASGCKIEKLNDTQLNVKGKTFEIAWSSELWHEFPTLANVQKNINIKWFGQIDKDTFKVETDKIKLVGDLQMVYAFLETAEGIHSCECVGKVVLDVGGFQGETAAYFSSIGAKKVIVYEPVVSHHKFIETNMALNNVNAELHEEGIGNMNGNQTIHYENLNLNFGNLNFGIGKGAKSVEIRIRNIVDVIKESNADIAKFDCEGAETALLQVPIQILRRISYYMIEVHSSEIMEAINQKFKTSGFKLTKKFLQFKDPEISVVHFART